MTGIPGHIVGGFFDKMGLVLRVTVIRDSANQGRESLDDFI